MDLAINQLYGGILFKTYFVTGIFAANFPFCGQFPNFVADLRDWSLINF